MKIRLALATLLCVGCVIEDADSVKPIAGDGIVVGEDESIALDTTRVVTPPTSCNAGQILERTAGGWRCVPPPSSPNVNDLATATLDCADGQVAKRSAGAWSCQDDLDGDTLADLACAANQILRWNATSGWVCANEGGSVTGQSLGTLACGDGQVARYDAAQTPGNEWVCTQDLAAGTTLDGAAIATAADLTAHAGVADAHHARYTDAEATAAANAVVATHAGDPAAHGTTLASLEAAGCGAGTVPTYNAGWSCQAGTSPWTVAGQDVFLNTGTRIGVGSTTPSTTFDLTGGFTMNKLGTPSGLAESVPDSESMHVFVTDNQATFVSEQDDGTGDTGGFDFIMDADDTQTPKFRIITKTGGTLSAPIFQVAAGGAVGIGTDNPNRKLSVNGGASKNNGGSWDVFSDARLKTVSGEFDPGLDEVMQLRPVRYRYKPDNALGLDASDEAVGFVAQEVEEVLPDAVSMGPSGYRLVNNDPIILAMLNAIQEQQQTITGQRGENDALRGRVERLEAVVAKLAEGR